MVVLLTRLFITSFDMLFSKLNFFFEFVRHAVTKSVRRNFHDKRTNISLLKRIDISCYQFNVLFNVLIISS